MTKSKSSYRKKLDRLKKKKKSFSVKDTPKGKVIKTKGKNGENKYFSYDSTTGELKKSADHDTMADLLHSSMLLIDSHMKWVQQYTGQKQTITFKEEYSRKVLFKLWLELRYPVNMSRNIKITIELTNCTIEIFQHGGRRQMELLNKKKK